MYLIFQGHNRKCRSLLTVRICKEHFKSFSFTVWEIFFGISDDMLAISFSLVGILYNAFVIFKRKGIFGAAVDRIRMRNYLNVMGCHNIRSIFNPFNMKLQFYHENK